MKILPNIKHSDDSLELFYLDTIYSGKNSKIKIKDFGKKLNGISSFFFEYLNQYNIPLAYKNKLENHHLIFERFTAISFHSKIMNTVNRKYSRYFGIPEYSQFSIPLIEFFADEDEKVLISENHIIVFDLLSIDEYKQILRICSKINAVLKSFFERRGVVFSGINCSFGKTSNGKIVLTGDFSPLSLSILHKSEKFNKSIAHRLNSGNELKSYISFLFELINNN